MSDILFKTNDYIFSYRVTGICVQNGKVLLQKPTNGAGFAFPGGHVAFGETNEETLRRELKEEISANIEVGDLKWVAEIFFPWGDKPCHQICLYYEIKLKDETQIPLEGFFVGDEQIEVRNFTVEFHWIPIERFDKIEVCPANAAELMKNYSTGVQHFVYREK